MARRVRFRRNPRWRDEIGRMPELAAETVKVARAASNAAEGASPRLFGHYRRKHKVGSPSFEDGVPVVPFGNDDVDANLVEFGGGGTPAYRPLTRGAEAAGLEFDPS